MAEGTCPAYVVRVLWVYGPQLVLAIAHVHMKKTLIEGGTVFYFSGASGQLKSIDISGKTLTNIHAKSHLKWGLNQIVTVTLDCENCTVKFEIGSSQEESIGKKIDVDLGTFSIPEEKTWYPCIMCGLADRQDFVLVE